MANAAGRAPVQKVQPHAIQRLLMMCLLAATRELSLPRLWSVRMDGSVRFLMLSLLCGCTVPIAVTSPRPTAAPPSASRDYDRIEAEVFVALNRARTNPQGTAAELDALTKYFNG